jgi:hypothetical protein
MKTKMTTLPLTNSIPSTTARRGFLLTPLVIALACLALSPTARAADGGLPNENTAEGDGALFSLTTGFGNTGLGFDALFTNMTGNENTAVGDSALSEMDGGFGNTAVGFGACEDQADGDSNTAIGNDALQKNIHGSFNTALGDDALQDNMASDNTATGASALQKTTTGGGNTATGEDAMEENTTGSGNAAFGGDALGNNTTGSGNIALGNHAGINLTTGSNNIHIGHVGVAGESAKIRIGTKGTQTNTFIAGISGVTVPGGAEVIIDTNGHLGTATSSARFKEAIKPMEKASEAILALKPVTFRYKHDLDPEGIPQFGLVAEQVEKVNPDLVARDAQGKVYTVRYEAVNAMLLNEFLKEHRQVQEQQKKIATLAAQLKEQAALIQKVSAQVELNKSSPKMAVNSP